MKPPSDQLKLLFVGLLRTASAFATSQLREGSSAAFSTAISASSTHSYYNPPANNVSLTLRIARLKDVADISACNLACLPENYNHAFYNHHIRQWPELAIVAVINDGDDDGGDENPRKPPHLTYQPITTTHTSSDHSENNKVVAYVLGKVEEHTEVSIPSMKDVQSFRFPQYTSTYTGHVTSLAVLEPYRRRGLAAELMKQLHYHLQKQSNPCVYCGLHVRKSNSAAVKLYEKFGYSTTQTIPAYYQDGEDAYYMTRPLLSSVQMEHETVSAGFLGNIMFRRRNKQDASLLLKHSNKSYENSLRLPRPVGSPTRISEEIQVEATSQQHDEQTTQQLMTGTL